MSNLLAGQLDEVIGATRDHWGELRGSRVFITGATGFFGCWLLETFAWANQHLNLRARATILTRNPAKFSQTLPHLTNAAIDVIVGDVRTFEFPNGTFSHVIHAATESSAELNAKQPQLMFDTIVEGTRRCLDFAARVGTRKFLFTSSGAVYGEQPPHLPHVPEDFDGGPDSLDARSAYAEGKRAGELLCALAVRNTRLEAKIARCFAFAGPYMKLDAHFAFGNFILDQLEGRNIVIKGDGTAVRSYMYATDLMIWLWTILFRGESGRAYNVGSAEAISIADLARQVASSSGKHTAVEILGKPLSGTLPARYVPSTARAREELGLKCSIPLSDAIERTLRWNQAQRTRRAADTVGVIA